MDVIWSMIRAFAVGGALCAVGELLMLRTNWTSARILVIFVCSSAHSTCLASSLSPRPKKPL